MPPVDAAGNYRVKPQRYLRLLGVLVGLASTILGIVIGGGAMLIKHGRDLETQDRDRQLVHTTAETVQNLAVIVNRIAEQQQDDHARLVELTGVHRRSSDH